MNRSKNCIVKSFIEPITNEDVEIVVKRVLGLDYKILNYHLRAYSNEKVGFMGAHCHLVVNYQHVNSYESESCRFFVKSIPYDNHEQVFAIEDSRAFYCETNFYKCIVPELLASIEDKTWIAKCHLVKEDALVLEDLKSRNFGVKNQILNFTQLKSVLTSLAKLHASSMLTEKRLGKTFDQMYSDVLKERLFAPYGRTYVWFQRGVDVAAEIARKLKLDHNCVSKICDRVIEILSKDNNVSKHNVICHGDAWSNNLMFNDSECIMVDYQWIRYAPGSVDVAQLLHLTTTRSFRDKFEKNLLMHYYDVLSGTLKKNDASLEIPSFYEVLNEYEDMRVIGIVTTVLYLPVTLMDPKLCTELTKDADGYAKIMFEDHADLVLDIMSRDEYYNSRITEVVVEMVERSGQFLNGCKV